MSNKTLSPPDPEHSKHSLMLRLETASPSPQSQFEEAREALKSLERFEKEVLDPILRNPLLIPMVPVFDARVNYYFESMNWQHFYQMEMGVNRNLEQLVQGLQKIIGQIQTTVSKCKLPPKKFIHKKNRRTAIQIDRDFKCPYTDCFKSYGSDVSLNLHIKIKHNGGNKTEREKLALQICEAELGGLPMPKVEIVFPPGYLQSYRKNFVHKYKLYRK